MFFTVVVIFNVFQLSDLHFKDQCRNFIRRQNDDTKLIREQRKNTGSRVNRVSTRAHLSVILLLVLHPHVLGKGVVGALSSVPVGHRLLSFLSRCATSWCFGQLWTTHLSWFWRRTQVQNNWVLADTRTKYSPALGFQLQKYV